MVSVWCSGLFLFIPDCGLNPEKLFSAITRLLPILFPPGDAFRWRILRDSMCPAGCGPDIHWGWRRLFTPACLVPKSKSALLLWSYAISLFQIQPPQCWTLLCCSLCYWLCEIAHFLIKAVVSSVLICQMLLLFLLLAGKSRFEVAARVSKGLALVSGMTSPGVQMSDDMVFHTQSS